MSVNYVLISEFTTNATTTSVTLNNIPQTSYTDLKLVWSARLASGSGFALLDFNGLATANFSNRVLEGTGSNAISFVSGNTNYAGGLVGAGDTANTFTNSELYIPNAFGSTAKMYSIDAVTENNGTTAYTDAVTGFWNNVAAITSIRLSTSSGVGFAANSTFSLYGIANFGTTPTVLPKASGGDIITNDGTYWYHAFLSSGIFTPSSNLTCDALVIAGGGGGAQNGGGGGAGGLVGYTSQSLVSQNYAVTVGAGGAGGTTNNLPNSGRNGNNSQFGALTASNAGGAGAAFGFGVGGSAGGSGGGAPRAFVSTGGAATPAGQGNKGGDNTDSSFGSGGGGGAGAAGGNGSANGQAGNGGAGTNAYSSWLSPTSLGVSGFIAGGGGGGSADPQVAGNPGVGGSGGGGNGKNQNTVGDPGVANTGSGGGGSGTFGGAGGSGVVIVRYTMA